MSVFNSLRLFGRLRKMEDQMVKFDDEVNSLKTDLDTALNTTVANLQTQLASAGLTADQQAALDAALAEADGLKASADALAANFPAPAPAPTPAPAPAPASDPSGN
jgi:hypothetical protein